MIVNRFPSTLSNRVKILSLCPNIESVFVQGYGGESYKLLFTKGFAPGSHCGSVTPRLWMPPASIHYRVAASLPHLKPL